MKKNANATGFSLMELLLVIIIMGILLAVLEPQIFSMVRGAKETNTKGNLAALRSALNIYYGDNGGLYPSDQMESLTANNGKYMKSIPTAETPDYHGDSNGVVNSTTDANGWTYGNDPNNPIPYGTVWVNCTHTDSHGSLWINY